MRDISFQGVAETLKIFTRMTMDDFNYLVTSIEPEVNPKDIDMKDMQSRKEKSCSRTCPHVARQLGRGTLISGKKPISRSSPARLPLDARLLEKKPVLCHPRLLREVCRRLLYFRFSCVTLARVRLFFETRCLASQRTEQVVSYSMILQFIRILFS